MNQAEPPTIVLVVDDDELVLEVTAALLVTGFVSSRRGPRQPSNRLAATLVDAILCDVDLQDSMDGFALKGGARANSTDVPVLLTTAFRPGRPTPRIQDEILSSVLDRQRRYASPQGDYRRAKAHSVRLESADRMCPVKPRSAALPMILLDVAIGGRAWLSPL